MINLGKEKITNIAISSILGHGGSGNVLMMLGVPGYKEFCDTVKKTGASVLTKSGTCLPWQGVWNDFDPRTWKCVQDFKDDSMVNNYGLTNKGIMVNRKKIHDAIKKGFNVIPNIYPQFFRGLEVAIKQTIVAIALYWEELDGDFFAVEISVSCNNTKEKIAENIQDVIALAKAVRRAFPWLKVIYKINHDHPYELSQELELLGLADVIHSINSIRYEKVYGIPNTSPLYGMKGVNGGGSLSGGEGFMFSYEYTRGLRKVIKLPILMGLGISSLVDVRRCIYECIDIRTDALSICSVGKRNPPVAIDLLHRSWQGMLKY